MSPVLSKIAKQKYKHVTVQVMFINQHIMTAGHYIDSYCLFGWRWRWRWELFRAIRETKCVAILQCPYCIWNSSPWNAKIRTNSSKLMWILYAVSIAIACGELEFNAQFHDWFLRISKRDGESQICSNRLVSQAISWKTLNLNFMSEIPCLCKLEV